MTAVRRYIKASHTRLERFERSVYVEIFCSFILFTMGMIVSLVGGFFRAWPVFDVGRGMAALGGSGALVGATLVICQYMYLEISCPHGTDPADPIG